MMLIVTVVLLVAAVGFGLTAWRLWRADRERSKARVAALAAAIDGPPADSWSSDLDEFGPEHATRHTARAQGEQPVVIESMFNTERPTAVQGNPLMKVAIGLAMAVAVIVIIAMTSVRRDTPPASVTTQDSALELLSMSHSRERETLTVSGLVRNSGDGPAQDITAVVFAFDHNGSFVTSGRARLDDSTLRPGDESPFQVVIPKIKDIGRYRVSFRTEAGVVRHVDRRPSGLRAAN
jgi:hypothetical protein